MIARKYLPEHSRQALVALLFTVFAAAFSGRANAQVFPANWTEQIAGHHRLGPANPHVA